MALTNSVRTIISSVLTGTVGSAVVSSTISESLTNTLASADSVYTETGTISGGSNDIDLSGSLVDPLGNAVIFADVRYVYIVNNGANAMTIGGANNIPMLGSGDLLNLAASAYFSYVDDAGITVTAGTGDLITIAGTNGDTFDIIVIGSST